MAVNQDGSLIYNRDLFSVPDKKSGVCAVGSVIHRPMCLLSRGHEYKIDRRDRLFESNDEARKA